MIKMYKILATFHAALFGYEAALLDFIGARGYKTHVFPKIIEMVATLKDDIPVVRDIMKADSRFEAMNLWLQLLVEAKIIKEGSVEQSGDGYDIIIKGCSMAFPIHNQMGEQKAICANTLVTIAMSQFIDDDKVPIISYSDFTSSGSITHVAFKYE